MWSVGVLLIGSNSLCWRQSSCGLARDNVFSSCQVLISHSWSAVTPSSPSVHVVRDLGVYIDDELTMKQHVGKVVGACSYYLRRLRQIRRHDSYVLMAQLIYSFVTSNLDSITAIHSSHFYLRALSHHYKVHRMLLRGCYLIKRKPTTTLMD